MGWPISILHSKNDLTSSLKDSDFTVRRAGKGKGASPRTLVSRRSIFVETPKLVTDESDAMNRMIWELVESKIPISSREVVLGKLCTEKTAKNSGRMVVCKRPERGAWIEM